MSDINIKQMYVLISCPYLFKKEGKLFLNFQNSCFSKKSKLNSYFNKLEKESLANFNKGLTFFFVKPLKGFF